jgi:hypothetical protein
LDISAGFPVWNDLAVSIAWLVAGVCIHIGFRSMANAVKRAGDNVADTLWRIKPEDVEQGSDNPQK